MWRSLCFYSFFSLFGLLFSTESHATGLLFHGDLYSETQYDSRFAGAVTDTRFYNYAYFLKESLRPYGGFHFTRDLSNGGAPQAIENAFMPTLGLELGLLKKPYLFLFTEKRWIYRTESVNGNWNAEELRFGLIYYYKHQLKHSLFFETYGEWVQVDRVSSRAVFTTWAKFGHEINIFKNFMVVPFLEGFTRQSSVSGYGPTENELRLGLRTHSNVYGLNVLLLTNYALISNIKPGGFDGLIVLQTRFY